MKQILKEDIDLGKGIFWIVDENDLSKNRNYCFKINCDSFGNIDNYLDYDLNSKNGKTYNHKLVWEQLPPSMTYNKPFNYYPRGRVEIANGTAKIFLNPTIAYNEVIDFIKEQFNLYSINGINKVRVIEDGSEHYKCHSEDGWKSLK